MTKQENNNGWIKIESEADLPINLDCFYWCISKNYQDPWETHGTDIDSKHHTHYQPIQKPKPPIY